MGPESRSTPISASSPASSSSPSGKRTRDPEDEVYLDNLRSQKRYLSEVCLCYSIDSSDSYGFNRLQSALNCADSEFDFAIGF